MEYFDLTFFILQAFPIHRSREALQQCFWVDSVLCWMKTTQIKIEIHVYINIIHVSVHKGNIHLIECFLFFFQPTSNDSSSEKHRNLFRIHSSRNIQPSP
mmetsp:Transcript_5787/g.7742  ORF Transcript_5787/g.7742 Transcript_5787/m.7742 type:complete len:100 (-) Transcript_5787:1330-1629(-)